MKWLWVKNGYPKWLARVNRNMDYNVRSNSWWLHFDPYPNDFCLGYDGKFSFDFDSQWSAVFLDSVEPSADLSSMPSLGAMLNMPLIDARQSTARGRFLGKLWELSFWCIWGSLRLCFPKNLGTELYGHGSKPKSYPQ